MKKELTPKEKAELLIEQFSPLVKTWDCFFDAPRNKRDVRADAAECGLIVVDEVMDCCLNVDYWHDVKVELESIVALA